MYLKNFDWYITGYNNFLTFWRIFCWVWTDVWKNRFFYPYRMCAGTTKLRKEVLVRGGGWRPVWARIIWCPVPAKRGLQELCYQLWVWVYPTPSVQVVWRHWSLAVLSELHLKVGKGCMGSWELSREMWGRWRIEVKRWQRHFGGGGWVLPVCKKQKDKAQEIRM